jgi:hypothetical protein
LKLNNKYLEVVISSKGSRFKAQCPTFPNCKGTGATEKEAVDKLIRSISSYISKSAENALQSVMNAGSYTEIILDGSKKNKEQRRIFNLDPNYLKGQKDISFKFKQPEELEALYKEPSNDIDQFLSFAGGMNLDTTPATSSAQPSYSLDNNEPIESTNDGFMFGIHLSLN